MTIVVTYDKCDDKRSASRCTCLNEVGVCTSEGEELVEGAGLGVLTLKHACLIN